jgi:hypothetical protein
MSYSGELAGMRGLEPPHSSLTTKRTNQLCYIPKMERVAGLEPAYQRRQRCGQPMAHTGNLAARKGHDPSSSGFQSDALITLSYSSQNWSGLRDSNPLAQRGRLIVNL